ncbi:MAG: lipoprotein-releasing ABC transporter permease subunit [Parvibaculales bacterium]
MTTRPFAAFEWLLAFRYIRSRRRESVISVISWVSFLGIMLGVATLIIVMAVMNGFRDDLLSRILGVSGHATVESVSAGFEDITAVEAALGTVDGVVRVTPFLESQVMVSSGSLARGVVIRGLPQDKLERFPILADNILEGRLSDLADGDRIAVGARLAQRYGLEVGMPLALISPKGVVTPFGTAPRLKSYTIAAVFEVGVSEYDLSFLFTNAETLSQLSGLGLESAAIEVVVEDPDTIKQLRTELEAASPEEVYVLDWMQANATLSGALKVERNVMFLILTLILLVATLNIVSGLVMLVKDKGRDIAVLRTMGVSQGGILRIFLITGASIGITGTLAGLVLGIVFCDNIEAIRQFITFLTGAELFPAEVYFLRELPATIVFEEVVAVVVMALGLSFLSTLYPAWRAARLEPVEALRNE